MVAATTVLGAILRLRELGQPIRTDEATTWLDFASQPLEHIVSSYSAPNNHVFHSVLVHVVATLFGDAPAVLRLPAFIAGVLIIPLTWAAARRLGSPAVGQLAAALAATSSALVLYSTNARGYSIIGCLTLVAIVLVDRQLRIETFRDSALIAFCVAIGMWTIPTMLYPATGIALWAWAMARAGHSVVGARAMSARLMTTALGAAGISALLYAPILLTSGAAPLVANEYVRAHADGWSGGWLRAFVLDLWAVWFSGWPFWISAAVGITALGSLLSKQLRRNTEVSLLGTMLLCSVGLLWVIGHRPPARVVLYMLPVVYIEAAAGAVRGYTWVANHLALRARLSASLGIAAGVVVTAITAHSLVASGAVGASPETGTLVDAGALADLLAREGRAGDRVLTSPVAAAPLKFELRRRRVSIDLFKTPADSATRLWVVVSDAAPNQTLWSLLHFAHLKPAADFRVRGIGKWRKARLFTLDGSSVSPLISPPGTSRARAPCWTSESTAKNARCRIDSVGAKIL